MDVWITWRETRQGELHEASVSILSKEVHNAARRHLVRSLESGIAAGHGIVTVN